MGSFWNHVMNTDWAQLLEYSIFFLFLNDQHGMDKKDSTKNCVCLFSSVCGLILNIQPFFMIKRVGLLFERCRKFVHWTIVDVFICRFVTSTGQLWCLMRRWKMSWCEISSFWGKLARQAGERSTFRYKQKFIIDWLRWNFEYEMMDPCTSSLNSELDYKPKYSFNEFFLN